MVATLDGLLARHPRRLGRRAGVRRFRDELLAERERAAEELLGEGPMREEVLLELAGSRERVAAWRLPERSGLGTVQDGLRHTYRDGRRRFRRASSGRGGRLRRMHRWRKQVKRLRYAAEILDFGGLARRTNELAEVLGEERDLALLAKRIRVTSKHERAGEGGRRRLLKVIARRRRKLRRRALNLGGRVYRRRPRVFIKRIGRRYASRAGR